MVYSLKQPNLKFEFFVANLLQIYLLKRNFKNLTFLKNFQDHF